MAEKKNSHSVSQLIQEHYPEYFKWETYPADQCAPIRKITEPWGILGNFGHAKLMVRGVEFPSSELLFQMMKFRDEESTMEMWRARSKQMAKRLENLGKRREDWGPMLIDALKFAIMTKYEQCEEFRTELERSKGLYIVEDETKRGSSSYGAKLKGDVFEGSNLHGRLLMELRDNGRLDYTLPEDALDFIRHLKQQ